MRPYFIRPSPALTNFNSVCPLIERADLLSLYRPTETKGTANNAFSVYYGINISPYKEPSEQFDPLLLVNFWNRLLSPKFPADSSSNSWSLAVFIAGKYRVLNLAQGKNPESAYSQWEKDEQRKKAAWQGAISGLGLSSAAQILVTDDVWKDQRYWDIVCSIVSQKDGLPNQRQFKNIEQNVFFGDIPLRMLGGITQAQRDSLASFRACELYLYAEMAEAYFLRERFGVRAKIGPATEEEYDQYLRKDFSIIQLKSPVEFTTASGEPSKLIPYIGLKGQARFWIGDASKPDAKEWFSSVVEKQADYSGGPLEQWRARLAIWKSSSEKEFFETMRLLEDRGRLASEIVLYLKAIEGQIKG